jgi:hypothetical protein
MAGPSTGHTMRFPRLPTSYLRGKAASVMAKVSWPILDGHQTVFLTVQQEIVIF